MSNKKLAKELRCLRMHLKPLLTNDKLELLEEVERRLENPGTVSTIPAPASSKGKQGKRITKQDRINKYLYQ